MASVAFFAFLCAAAVGGFMAYLHLHGGGGLLALAFLAYGAFG